MFKVATEPTFTHTVEAMVPVDGGHAKENFKATFRAISLEESNKFDLKDVESVGAFIKRVVVSLDDIADAEGKAIPFNDQVFDQVLALPWARSALARTYFAAVSKAVEGN